MFYLVWYIENLNCFKYIVCVMGFIWVLIEYFLLNKGENSNYFLYKIICFIYRSLFLLEILK